MGHFKTSRPDLTPFVYRCFVSFLRVILIFYHLKTVRRRTLRHSGVLCCIWIYNNLAHMNEISLSWPCGGQPFANFYEMGLPNRFLS